MRTKSRGNCLFPITSFMGPFTPQNCFQAPSAGAFPSKTRGRTTTRPAPLPSGRGTPNNPKIPEADPFALSHTRGVAGVRLAGHLNSKQRKSKGNNRVFISRPHALLTTDSLPSSPTVHGVKMSRSRALATSRVRTPTIRSFSFKAAISSIPHRNSKVPPEKPTDPLAGTGGVR